MIKRSLTFGQNPVTSEEQHTWHVALLKHIEICISYININIDLVVESFVHFIHS